MISKRRTLQIESLEYRQLLAVSTLDVRVAASSDDAEERPSGSVTLTSSDLELTQDKTNQQIVGMRFTGLNVPPGASIQNAYLQFQADETGSTPTSLAIHGQAIDNAPTFTSIDGDIAARATTTSSVSWSPAPWNTRGEAGPAQQTPNIALVIQEIVNRPGWSNGNSLAIIVTGTGARTAESYNGAPSAAPLLHLEYEDGNQTGNQAPTTSGIANVNVNTDAPNTVISLFAAFDDAEDPDPALAYSIENNTNPSLFTSTTINGVQGTMTLDYAPSKDGAAEITVRATDTGSPPLFVETSFTVTVDPGNPGGTATLEIRVNAGSDDAEEKSTGSVKLTSSDLELTVDNANQQIVGLRFNSLNLPQGATIQNAYLQFKADEAGSAPTSLVIRGQAINNAPTFISTNGNVSSRTRTNASVPWSPATWNKGDAGTAQRTPNIASVIQEIVNRPGWSAGNSLAVIVTGTGTRTAESYDAVPAEAPLLHVEYSVSGNATPTAVNDTATTSEGSSVTSNVLVNDFLGNPPTTITAVSQGNNGNVTFNSGVGTTTYMPIGSFTGSDSYTYTITDTDGDTSTATVDVTVTGGAPQSLVIRVVGDVPYDSGEYAELEADLANLGPNDEFFVHLGDIKSGSGACSESVYTSAESSLLTSSKPVFIIPGDNEWNDCGNPNQAWGFWDSHLMRLEENWSLNFSVMRQSVREENFAFVHSGVLFIGINLVGGSVHDSSEWAQRMTDNANWVNQNFANFGSQVTSAAVFGHAFPDPNTGPRQQFGQDFVAAAQSFAKPILYMMGDEHHWVLDNPYNDAPNVTRVTVEQGVPSVRVTINDDPTDPFTFDQSPLMLQSTVSPPNGAEPIDEDQLAPIVDEAMSLLLQSAGSEVASDFAGLDIQVVDLPGSMLGRALHNTVQIDVDAAGFGWFVDATPTDNVEFMREFGSNQIVAAYGSPASGRVDLLTVVLHELGHVLGFDHTHSDSLMHAELPLGTRRLPSDLSLAGAFEAELTGKQVDRFYQLFDTFEEHKRRSSFSTAHLPLPFRVRTSQL